LSPKILALLAVLPLLAAGDPNARDLVEWPSPASRPVFLFKNAFEEVLAFRSGEDQPIFNYELQPSGFARPLSSGALSLAYGSYLAPEQGAYLAGLIAAGKTLALELFLKPEQGAGGGILRLGGATAATLALDQHHGRLQVTGAGGARLVAELPDDRGSHLFLIFGGTRLELYRDGVLVDAATLPASSDNPDSLAFGSGSPDDRGWSGCIEGIAIYTEPPDSATIQANAEAFHHLVDLRRPVPRIRLEARLTTRSHLPTLEEIAPYTESLAVYEYEVVRVIEGAYLARRIRVAHRVILDGRHLPVRDRIPGATVTLTIEPFEANRQLKNVHLSDTLEFDFDLDLYFNVDTPF